jgi:hypothetical protein
MVPIGDSMVYLRPLYVAATTKPQPQLQYVVAVLGKDVAIESNLSAVLQDVLQTPVASTPGSGPVTTTGTVPTAVAQELQQAQTDYNNAQTALQQDNLAQYQSDINAMEQEIAAARQVIDSTTGSTTTTTTQPKGTKSSKTATNSTSTTTSTAPSSTEPQGSSTTSTTSTTLASAAARRR